MVYVIGLGMVATFVRDLETVSVGFLQSKIKLYRGGLEWIGNPDPLIQVANLYRDGVEWKGNPAQLIEGLRNLFELPVRYGSEYLFQDHPAQAKS